MSYFCRRYQDLKTFFEQYEIIRQIDKQVKVKDWEKCGRIKSCTLKSGKSKSIKINADL